MEHTVVTNGAIITDCRDSSAKGRLKTRWRALFDTCDPTFVKIKAHTSELECGSTQAVMHLLDQIDASRAPGQTRSAKESMLILVNSATRGETPQHRPNGSPFCWWRADKHTLIVSTMDGPVLPHANYLGLIPSGMVHELSVPEVMSFATHKGWVTETEKQRICESQFRSLEFQPLVAKWILQGWEIPSEAYTVPDYLPSDVTVLYRDSFGNLTLNVTAEQFGYEPGREVILHDGQTARCVPSLKDVPQSHTKKPLLALTIGSNGLRDPQTGQEQRFLELVIMQRSAAKYTGLRPGKTAILAANIPANQYVG